MNRLPLLFRLCLMLWLSLLAGCAAVDVRDYRSAQPVLDLAQYFNGPLEAWGMYQSRSGQVQKRFHVHIEGRWQGNTGTLDERFTYADGSTQRRVWTVTKLADGRYTGRADDVVGEAQGESAGNALRWRYTLALPVDGRVWQVEFDDWMYLIDEHTLLNRSAMSKFGIELGQVTLAFRKP